MSSNQEMPEIVYHYTSMDALLNIHATGVIWATNIRYLNDVSEREHFFSLIRSRAKPLNESGLIFPGLFDRVLEDNEEDKPFHDLPFVASFCRERTPFHNGAHTVLKETASALDLLLSRFARHI